MAKAWRNLGGIEHMEWTRWTTWTEWTGRGGEEGGSPQISRMAGIRKEKEEGERTGAESGRGSRIKAMQVTCAKS